MLAAPPVIPLVDDRVTVRALAELPQPLLALRVALLAARHGIAPVDEAGLLVAEAAP